MPAASGPRDFDPKEKDAPGITSTCDSSETLSLQVKEGRLKAGFWIAPPPVVESQWGEQDAVMLLQRDYPEATSMLESLRSRQDVHTPYRNNLAIGLVEDTRHKLVRIQHFGPNP